MGRITWLCRMAAPGIDTVVQRVPRWHTYDDGSRRVAEESVPCDDAALLAEWLALSWQPIQRVLEEWTVDDLFHTYLLDEYVVSRQWTSGESCPMTSTMADNWPRCSLFKASTPSN